jgi:hypothetical protein
VTPLSRHNQGGGMFVGPDHPIFGGDQNQRDPSGGIFGGPQPLPRYLLPLTLLNDVMPNFS